MIALTMVAALFVETNGIYFGLSGVDPWDRERDARNYAGPHRVVAHPPCDRWCQMAPVNEARYGHKIGDDDGCFAAALDAVRAWGGVLEHPAFTLAWPAFGLPRPLESGGWQRGFCGGWSAHVEQRHYGHRARKATWLYCYGIEPPSLRWGPGPEPEAWISTDRPRAELAEAGIDQLSKKEAKATPIEFRDLLISIARQKGGSQMADAQQSSGIIVNSNEINGAVVMKPEYEPRTREQFYGYLIEECGEVMHAAGKTLRWGEHSVNPEIPPSERETNLVWLRRELGDLRGAIARIEGWIEREYG